MLHISERFVLMSNLDADDDDVFSHCTTRAYEACNTPVEKYSAGDQAHISKHHTVDGSEWLTQRAICLSTTGTGEGTSRSEESRPETFCSNETSYG